MLATDTQIPILNIHVGIFPISLCFALLWGYLELFFRSPPACLPVLPVGVAVDGIQHAINTKGHSILMLMLVQNFLRIRGQGQS